MLIMKNTYNKIINTKPYKDTAATITGHVVDIRLS